MLLSTFYCCDKDYVQYIYVCVHMCIKHISAHMYTYIHIWIWIHICVCACVYVYVHTYMHIK